MNLVNTKHEEVRLAEKLSWPWDLGNFREGFVLEVFIFRFEDISTHFHALNTLTFRVRTWFDPRQNLLAWFYIKFRAKVSLLKLTFGTVTCSVHRNYQDISRWDFNTRLSIDRNCSTTVHFFETQIVLVDDRRPSWKEYISSMVL